MHARVCVCVCVWDTVSHIVPMANPDAPTGVHATLSHTTPRLHNLCTLLSINVLLAHTHACARGGGDDPQTLHACSCAR